MLGTTDDTFTPDGTMTRAMFVTAWQAAPPSRV